MTSLIIRAHRPETNFYMLDKRISEDKELSWAARGMLIFLLGKPNNWKINPEALVNETQGSSRSSGRDAVYAILKELRDTGYIMMTKNSDGTTCYYIHEHPNRDFPDQDNPDRVFPDDLVSTEKAVRIENPLKGLVRTAATDLMDEGFLAFWSAYPKKDGRMTALKSWVKLSPGPALMKTIMDALELSKTSRQWTREAGQFIPLASTWLNNRRWEDESIQAMKPKSLLLGAK